ncbi:MAG TPA: hypothetical protein PKO09_00690 [Anaerolineae bacterium]|nr:hypothetical protein [Anaerolineae bacterium]
MPDRRTLFDWGLHPEAEAWMAAQADELFAAVPSGKALPDQMLARASCRLLDCLDHLVLPDGEATRALLLDLGFGQEDADAGTGDRVFALSGAVLPRVVLRAPAAVSGGGPLGAYLLVESIPSFAMAHRCSIAVEGTPLSPYRAGKVWTHQGRWIGVVERRAHSGFIAKGMPADYPGQILAAFERWAGRRRRFAHVQEGMAATLRLAERLVAEVGTDTGAWVFCEAERAYWQQRNWAGQVQKARQDALGLGWGNQDHCAFRSSREGFAALIQILKTFGFQPRERFYAGAEAGWGAQVMEQQTSHFGIFCDVDLSPDEVYSDFSRTPLAQRDELGTIGLWCALHGDSMLEAGTHHLAARLDFEGATATLPELGIKLMSPFSELSYLRQAFTRGERWPVELTRLDGLAAVGLITSQQRALFEEKGALSSHMECIQRGQGFKGFNQQRVSDIIHRTDPRLTGDS